MKIKTNHKNGKDKTNKGSEKPKKIRKKVKCDVCNQIYASQWVLDRHKEEFHDGYKCKLCDKSFAANKKQKQEFKDHISNVHGGNTEKCEECGEEFPNISSLKPHIKQVHGKGPKKFHCDKCFAAFHIKSRLDKHVRTVHEGIKDFHCDRCGKSFTTKDRMLCHVKAMHEGLDIEARRVFNCNLCTHNFISQQNLLRHVSSVHFGEKNFKCEICGKDFVELGNLKRHKLNVHDGVKPFKCEYLLDGKQCTAAYHQNHETCRSYDPFRVQPPKNR